MSNWQTDDESREAAIQAELANAWEAWLEKTYVDPAEKEDPVTDAEVMSGCYCEYDYQCTPCAVRQRGPIG